MAHLARDAADLNGDDVLSRRDVVAVRGVLQPVPSPTQNVLQKSIPTQIRQLIVQMSKRKEQVDEYAEELTSAQLGFVAVRGVLQPEPLGRRRVWAGTLRRRCLVANRAPKPHGNRLRVSSY